MVHGARVMRSFSPINDRRI